MSVFKYETIGDAMKRGYAEMHEINLSISEAYFSTETQAAVLNEKNIMSKRWCLDETRRDLSSQP